jgi:hypothetical protein
MIKFTMQIPMTETEEITEFSVSFQLNVGRTEL